MSIRPDSERPPGRGLQLNGPCNETPNLPIDVGVSNEVHSAITRTRKANAERSYEALIAKAIEAGETRGEAAERILLADPGLYDSMVGDARVV